MSQESPATPPYFPLGANVAAEIGLTNTEWMFHQWTEEWPPDVQDKLSQCYRAQTAALGRLMIGTTSNAETNSQPIEPGMPEPSPEWSSDVLCNIADSVVIHGDDAVGQVAKALELARRWQEASRSVSDIMSDDVLSEHVRRIYEVLDKQIDVELNPHVVADLFDVKGYIADGAKDHLQVLLLRNVIGKQPLPVLGQIIDRDSPAGRISFSGFQRFLDSNATRPPQEIHTADMAVHLLDPLANRIGKAITKEGLEAATDEITFTSELLLKLLIIPDAMPRAIESGFSRQHTADRLFGALQPGEASIERGYPNHGLTTKIVDSLIQAYRSNREGSLELPVGFLPFVAKLYKEKILAYSQSYATSCKRRFRDLSMILNVNLT